jgi:hypothetical protein
MQTTDARRQHGVIISAVRHILPFTIGVALLIGAAGESAATSLVVVHTQGGPGHGAIAAMSHDEEIEVSRSVGLMDGAASTSSAIALGDTLVEISRSVGLMEGAVARSSTTALGDMPIQISRSVGLMEGASN